MARKREASAEEEMTSCDVGVLPASLISCGSSSRSRKEKRAPREPDMSQKERELWRDLIWRRSGLFFPDTRLRFLRHRIWERVGNRGLASYAEYYQYVQFNKEGNSEFSELLELLLNKESQFFRHPPSFEALTKTALPELMAEKEKDGDTTLNLWSAGCSKGQEAYSLAIAAGELPATRGWNVRVLGSDLSLRSLEHARRGRYRTFETRMLPEPYKRRFMPLVEDHGEHIHQVVDQLKSIVRFLQVNLNDLDSHSIAGMDVIFCQNVLIYFRTEDRVKIAKALAERLNPGGYLFLAPAEAVGLALSGMQLVRVGDAVAYRRSARNYQEIGKVYGS
jgi:chemotaxis methyl-accepting protein methylase